jgi:DNA-binding transcriptional LysR family regulator
MNLRWDDLQLFLAVYEQGSLSAAARLLQLAQPTLSQRISELEQTVDEPLFVRQSQGMRLTGAGQKLLPAAQHMAEWASEAAASIRHQTDLPQGKVRIAAPPLVAYEVLAPLAAEVRRRYPAIRIEILAGVETLNLSRGEADLSLRITRPSDNELLCLDSVLSPWGVYASAAYAASLPPKPLATQLDWISWAPPFDQLLSYQELQQQIPDFTPAVSADDINVQLAACLAGAGVMLLPQVLQQHSRLPHLRQLLQLDVDLGPAQAGEMFLVCHKRQRDLPKMQKVIELLQAEFARMRGAS